MSLMGCVFLAVTGVITVGYVSHVRRNAVVTKMGPWVAQRQVTPGCARIGQPNAGHDLRVS